MKITEFGTITSKYLKSEKVKSEKSGQKSSSAPVEKESDIAADKIEISSYAMAARSIDGENKDFDLRIDRIKEAVQNGRYNVNTEKIAKLMLEL